MSTPTTEAGQALAAAFADADLLTRTGVVTSHFVRRLAEEHAGIRAALLAKPLTHDQQSILASIASAPYPGGGWIWSNDSGTRRLLDALVKRGLVGTQEGAHGRLRYTAIPEVSATWRAQENERARAYNERQAAKQAERDAQRAAARARLDADVTVLRLGLDVLERRGSTDPEALANARARVDALAKSFG